MVRLLYYPAVMGLVVGSVRAVLANRYGVYFQEDSDVPALAFLLGAIFTASLGCRLTRARLLGVLLLPLALIYGGMRVWWTQEVVAASFQSACCWDCVPSSAYIVETVVNPLAPFMPGWLAC
jgi:hypothetical protein